jgi:hypothetical protein
MKHTSHRRNKMNNKSRKIGICNGYCCDATHHGLQEWYKMKFEKLGWMILAKNRGMNDKVMEYKNSVNRLEKAIEHKLKYHTRDGDRKDDLLIMMDNVEILKNHIDQDFN